jgi:hypothetical protein
MVRRRWWIAVLVTVVLVAAGGGAWYAFGRGHHSAARADGAMAARAQQVMPFDLNRTTHTFTKTADGGTETVMVKDSSDTRDLTLIRSHLSTVAAEFRNGDYSDPAKIHGMNMPGVKDLEAGASRVTVDYSEIPDGAQIRYSSTEPALISALHAWFDRQISDHSMPGMGG